MNLLEYIPMPALGMVLIISTYSLLSFRSILSMRKRNREAFSYVFLMRSVGSWFD